MGQPGSGAGSTLDPAFELALARIEDGRVVDRMVATGGQGRRGRAWQAAQGQKELEVFSEQGMLLAGSGRQAPLRSRERAPPGRCRMVEMNRWNGRRLEAPTRTGVHAASARGGRSEIHRQPPRAGRRSGIQTRMGLDRSRDGSDAVMGSEDRESAAALHRPHASVSVWRHSSTLAGTLHITDTTGTVHAWAPKQRGRDCCSAQRAASRRMSSMREASPACSENAALRCGSHRQRRKPSARKLRPSIHEAKGGSRHEAEGIHTH